MSIAHPTRETFPAPAVISTVFTRQPKSTPPHRSTLTVTPGASREKSARLHARLIDLLGQPLNLRINKNTSTLLSVIRPRDGSPPRFSVHKMFLDAPDNVVKALAQYVKRVTPASQTLLREYMDAHTAALEAEHAAAPANPAHKKRLQLRARGAIYDLHKLADEVNRDYFDGQLKVNITWSRGARETITGRRRHIIFGSYEKRHALIRIHPALDSADVPEFFVKFVIHHEMLHHVLDPLPQPGGRRCIHTPEFKNKERRHPDFKRAMEWERLFMQGLHK